MIKPKLFSRPTVYLFFLIAALVSFTTALASPECENCPPDSPPYFIDFDIADTLHLCPDETIYDTIMAADSNTSQTVNLSKLSGPGDFTQQPGNPAEGYFQFTPPGIGEYEIIFMAKDDNGDSTIVSKTYIVSVNEPPQIITGDTSYFQCEGGDYFYVDVDAIDPDSEQLRYRLHSYQAGIDSVTGMLKFWADEPGVYCHTVAVYDECSADTVEICVTIEYNTYPEMANPDLTFTACAIDTICFDISVIDPDIGDSIDLVQVSGPGVFTSIDDRTGQTCFLPADVDSAQYIFIYEATDECLRGEVKSGWPQQPIADTVVVTVLKGQDFTLECPGDTSLFICEPDTICFDIGDIPSSAQVTVNPPSAWYDAQAGTVCFYTNCTVRKDIEVIVDTECGIDTCMFSVDVTYNSSPVVMLTEDTSFAFCEPQEICLPVGISDVDNNLAEITISPMGYYNEQNGRVCFTPQESGDYVIVVTATDSCGISDKDSVMVTVDLNIGPTVEASIDSSMFMCQPEEVCFPVNIIDPDDTELNIDVIGGTYQNGYVCFIPGLDMPIDDFGIRTYEIIISAIDQCGLTDSDTAIFRIDFNDRPMVTLPETMDVFQCVFEDICIYPEITDPDGNLMNVSSNFGSYNPADGSVCFFPDTVGTYMLIVTAGDSCNVGHADTIDVIVSSGETAVIDCPDGPINKNLCGTNLICYPLGITPANAEISTSMGTYENGEICFTADTSGTYIIDVIASAECGSDSCQLVFNVSLDEMPSVACPNDTSVELCESSTVCMPVNIYPATADLTITPEGAYYENGNICLTIDESGSYEVTVIAATDCGADTCSFTVDANFNIPPYITPSDTSFASCDPVEQLSYQVTAEDIEGDQIYYTLLSGFGSIDAMTGLITYAPDTSGLYCFTVKVTDSICGSDTAVICIGTDINEPPSVTMQDDFAVEFCEPEEICIQTIIGDDAPNSLIIDVVGGEYRNGYVCFTPTESGTYELITTVTDTCGYSDSDTTNVTVEINSAPEIVSAEDFSAILCETEPVCFPVSINDYEGNISSITTNIGQYNSESGEVCFTPDGAGTYMIITTVSDSCFAFDSDTTTVTIEFGETAVIDCPEPIEEFLCGPTEYCLPININPIDANVWTSFGYYSNGELCFNVDTAGTYIIDIIADSECGSDTCTVSINFTFDDQEPIVCPNDTSVFICQPDTICVPVEGVPADANLTVWPISAWYDEQSQSICFYTNCSVEKTLKIYNETACGTDSCVFTVDVTMNSEPLVFMFDRMNFDLCEPSPVCMVAAVGDQDDNIIEITTSENTTYNPITGYACFTPPGAGTFVVKVRALDECGAWSMDSTIVNITINEPPVVNLPDYQEFFLCDPAEVCIPAESYIYDPDGDILDISILPYGSYDPQTGEICITPEIIPDTVDFTIQAIDECGNTAVDTMTIAFHGNRAPSVSIPDTSLALCEYTQICLPITVSDPDGNMAAIESLSDAEIIDGQLCFTPSSEGILEYIVRVTDSCGAVGYDTALVTIDINEAPVVDAAADFTELICGETEICFDVSITDPDDNISNININSGIYNEQSDAVCFFADSSGVYSLIITAEDSCGEIAADTINVTVDIGLEASIACPDGPITYDICDAQTLCYPLEILPQNAVVSTSYGSYENGQLCFMADTSGIYIIDVYAEAECGADTCQIEFAVNIGQGAEITCPNDTTVFLCSAGSICIPVSYTPETAEIMISPVGEYVDGNICFNADTSGIYGIQMIASSDCGTDTCEFNVTVEFNIPPVVDAGNDTTIFMCEFEQVCLPVNITDSDNLIARVEVSNDGFYNGEADRICFTPPGVGTYCLIVTAYDECDATDSDTVCVTITTGEVAEIQCPAEPLTAELCDPEQLCYNIPITPSSAEVSVSHGTYSNGQLCFFADTAGTYNIRIIAEESCGSDTCDITVNVNLNEYVEITCPDLPTSASLCEPDTISILLPISTPTADVTISPFGSYDFNTQTLKFFADTSGQYIITIVAETPCNADTCNITANITISNPPEIVCPPDIDTLVCLAEIDEICFDLEVTGTDVNVTVEPEGTYSGGMVCVPVTEVGSFITTIIATSLCGADTCEMNINIDANLPPELVVPEDRVIPWCEDDTGQICIEGIFATDFENDDITLTQTCGLGEFSLINPDSGVLCFSPLSTDTTYEFCFQADDGCSISMETLLVTVYPSASCSVCVDIAINTDSCVVVGSVVPVYLDVETNDPIGGFDLLIGYDQSALNFYRVDQGSAIDEWEYFEYRIVGPGSCYGSCPSGMIRIVGIADENDGSSHPPQEQLSPQGRLARLTMHVTNDQNLGGQFLPIRFFWNDCGDNTFTSPGGFTYFDSRIYDAFEGIIWDEMDDVRFPESERIHGIGAPDSCLVGDKVDPERCIYFHNGGICVKHPDEIDDRGDVNLNAVAYEIGDAVVLTNYFIYGLAAFTVNIDGQVAASDVNADGFSLTVADLVYLIRVITGDALPVPKVIPNEHDVSLAISQSGDMLSVKTAAECEMGAGLLVFEYDGVTPEIPTLGSNAQGMEMVYRIDEDEIRVLIYSLEEGRSISRYDGELLNIGFDGYGEIRLIETEFAGYNGEPMKSDLTQSLIPTEFEVSQNYPNPFNPTTTIDLAIPNACHWQMAIYNINGQMVRQYEGDCEAGYVKVTWDGTDEHGYQVASGIYFYKVSAGQFTETRKMTLLK